MPNLENLKSVLKNNPNLVIPDPKNKNFLDLIHAILLKIKYQNIKYNQNVIEIANLIGEYDHYLFILIDALGLNIIKSLPKESLLKKHLISPLQTIFPSTTASVLTTIATASPPSIHSIPGWWTYIERLNISVIALQFMERLTKRPASDFGLTPEDFFIKKSVWSEVNTNLLTVTPLPYVKSIFAKYLRADTPCTGYTSLNNAVDIICSNPNLKKEKSFTYFYYPEVDSLSHQLGPYHEEVLKEVNAIEEAVKNINSKFQNKLRIILIADHGQTDLDPKRRIALSKDDPIMKHLKNFPSGEPSVPIFHIKENHKEDFHKEFNKKLANYFTLITPEEADRLHIYGSPSLSKEMKERLGDYIGICTTPATCSSQCDTQLTGIHGGMSKDEMEIGLILI